MDIIKPYHASEKSIDFSKLKGLFVLSNTLLYNSDLLELYFNNKIYESVEVVDKLVVVPVNSSSGVVYKFVGKNIEYTIAYNLSDLDVLCYSSRDVKSDGSQEATLKGHWILTNDVSNVKKTINKDGDDTLDKIYFEYGSFVDEKKGHKYDYAINIDIAKRLLEKNGGAKMSTNNNVNNNSCSKEAKNMNIGGVDLGQIVGMKMLSSLTKNKDVDLGKLMLVQSLAGGQPIQINDIMKAKLMSALVKDDTSIDDLPVDKLIMYKMFDSGNIDINQIIQLKLMKSLFEEDNSSEPAAKKPAEK